MLAVVAGLAVVSGNRSQPTGTAPVSRTATAPATDRSPASPAPSAPGPTSHASTPARTTSTRSTTPRPTRSSPTTPARNVLSQNTVYTYGRVSSVGCRMSSAGFGTVASARSFWMTELGCLNTTWSKVMKATGHRFFAPQLSLFSASVISPCGPYSAQTPFYCFVNHTIYMQVSYPMSLWRSGPQYNRDYDRAWQSFQLAHEYGHHVQAMSGIIEKGETERTEAGEDTASGLALSRRIELQAHCFSGTFLRANAATYLTDPGVVFQLRYALTTPIGDSEHGTRVDQAYWMHRGYDNRSTTLCNTWAQSATHVA